MTTLMDWPGLMRVGLHELRLSPAEFWKLTPAELLLIMGAEGREAPLGRSRLEELAALFPDKKKGAIP